VYLASKGAMATHKRPSFELKLRRNAWPAGAPPWTPLWELTDPLARLTGPTSKGDGRGEGREGQGKWYPQFLGESYAPIPTFV